MPRKDRKMVPVPTWLHDKLHGIADCWEEAYIGGKPVAVRSPDGSVPLWRVIADLIRRYEEHRERSRRSQAKRTGKPPSLPRMIDPDGAVKN